MSTNSFSENIRGYEVYEELGRGGFATVHRAKCRKTGTMVAIKMIDSKSMKLSKMTDRVRQEARIHLVLGHPSILNCYACFEDVNYVYLVLELCHNGELQNYLKKVNGSLKEADVIHIMRQVVEGVQYLHSHNIAHRDLSLSNLLLTSDMKIKIADFGLAVQLPGPGDRQMTMCGTPNFISPEVASRSSHGLEADLWSLGCLLYTLLVGKPPFETKAIESTLDRVISADYKLPSSLSPEAKDLIRSLLKRNPRDRISSYEILEHKFFQKCNSIFSGATTGVAQDSGIHTMNSKSSSAFSNSGLKNFPPDTNSHAKYASAEYLPHSLRGSQRSHHSIKARPQRSQSRDGLRDSNSCTRSNPQVEIVQKPCNYPCTSSPRDVGRYFTRESPQTNQMHQRHNRNFSQEVVPERIKYLKEHPPDNPGRIRTNSGCSHSDSANNPRLKVVSSAKTKTFPQLCSFRLPPTRQETTKTIISILDTEEICIEFMVKKYLVRQVCRISSDGARIALYQLNNGKGAIKKSTPPPLPPEGCYDVFQFEDLPEKHWEKYTFALNFVNTLKAITVKVTFYSDKAKCCMMESLKDFNLTFYGGGTVVQSAARIKITHCSGYVRVLKKESDSYELTGSLRLMWDHFVEARNHCLLLESTIKQLPGEKYFPVEVGDKSKFLSLADKENRLPSQTRPLATVSINNVGAPSGSGKVQVVVPGIGIATQLSNSEVHVLYPDRSELWFGKITRHKNYGEQVEIYPNHENLPPHIQEKVRHMDRITTYLCRTTRKT